jgi:VanZ family protein
MRWYYWAAAALYCAGIFYLSSSPAEAPALLFPHQDKVFHAVLYGGLTALISAGMWRAPRSYPAGLHFWVPVVFATLYGLSDEIHQRFVPGRTFDLLDLAADVAGALLAQSAVFLVLFRLFPRETRTE